MLFRSRRPPRNSKDGIFAGGVGGDIAYQGLLVTLLTLAAYFIGHFMEAGEWAITNSPDGMTMAFLTMSMCEIFHSLNMRSQKGSVVSMTLHGSHNKFLALSTIASFVTTTAVIYIPGLNDAFGFEHIDVKEYAVAMALAVSIIPLVEIVKAFQRLAAKRKQKKA